MLIALPLHPQPNVPGGRLVSLAVAAVLLTCAVPALPSDAASACAAMANDVERLACYDALFRVTRHEPEVPAAASTATGSPGADSSPTPAETTMAEVPENAEDARIAAFGADQMQEAKAEPATLSEISARITQIGKTSAGREAYYLDNDQVWVKTTDRRFTVREGDDVRIVAGRFGSFSLVTSRNARTSVERIR